MAVAKKKAEAALAAEKERSGRLRSRLGIVASDAHQISLMTGSLEIRALATSIRLATDQDQGWVMDMDEGERIERYVPVLVAEAILRREEVYEDEDGCPHTPDGSALVCCRCRLSMYESVTLSTIRAVRERQYLHAKHPSGDYCVYCRSQWPCEESEGE